MINYEGLRMNLPDIRRENIKDKRVFVRCDLDVPLVGGKIGDDTRLLSAIPTIEYLLKNNAKVIIGGHLGRPKGTDKSLSLEPIARWLFKEFKIRNLKFEFKLKIENLKFTKLASFGGWEIGPNIFLLENLRFNAGEEANDPEFGKKLASLAQIYVNDAFGVCHRNNASIVAITKYLPHFAGIRLQEEVEVLGKILSNPDRPLVVVIGGEKIETKLPLVEKMLGLADYVLVGGEIASELPPAEISNKNIIVAVLNKNKTDINSEDSLCFSGVIKDAKTVIWNGPMGVIQKIETEKGTRQIAQSIIQSKAFSVVGGGSTVAFLRKEGFLDKFSFVSTGGGAMLSLLSGEKLPGLAALEKN